MASSDEGVKLIVTDITLFGLEPELVDRFKKFARDNGFRRLGDALRLLLNLSDISFLLGHFVKELDDLRFEVKKKDEIPREVGVKTFGGVLNGEDKSEC